MAMTCACHSSAWAKLLGFGARVDQSTISVGETITLDVAVVTDDGFPSALPTRPDFGGLRPASTPATSHQTSITNGERRFTLGTRYLLVGEAPGNYRIGACQITLDGQSYLTQPITIRVNPAAADSAPPSLSSKRVLHPVTADPEVNRQLRGKIFVLPAFSNETPYVGEPVLATFTFYFDPRLSPQGISLALPEYRDLLPQVVDQPQSLNLKTVEIDGRQYHSALLYQVILTPAHPGLIDLSDFGVRFRLPLSQGSRRRSAFDDSFLDPFFSSSIEVEARAADLKLEARALPVTGQPTGFSGTVGEFSLDSQLDQSSANEDDVITLTMQIAGYGNAALAAVPAFPDNPDFEVVEAPVSKDEWTDRAKLIGKKSIEYLLRPKRSGTLSVPRIDYSVFDPRGGAYKALVSPEHTIAIAPRRGGAVTASPDAGNVRGAASVEPRLSYLKPIVVLQRETPALLTESPVYWGLQVLALGAAGLSFTRARRRERSHPAELRRARAWGALDKKLKKATAGPSISNPAEAGLSVERALREFAADWFNLSPDGLRGEEIAALLVEAGADEQRAVRFKAILESCSAMRYAPAGSPGADPALLAAEARALLAEVARP